MSLVISQTTTKKGILQMIEQTLGFPDAYITGDSTRQAQWLARVNLALDKVFHVIYGADGKFQFDDKNHTDYPIITTNIIASQRDYSFTTDENSNVILDIARVLYRSSTTTPYYELFPVDAQSDAESEISTIVDGMNAEGQPTKYDKTATGIFLDMIPPSAVTSGLKIYINREGSYFTSSDVTAQTKTPGFAGLYHLYCVLEPVYRYARANNLVNKETLKRDVLEMEKQITDYHSRRAKDERIVLTPSFQNYE